MDAFKLNRASRVIAAGVLGASTFGAGPAMGQESRADSLEVRVRRLEAVVDSLVRVLSARAEAAGPEPAALEPADELAALRAAAARAADEAAPAVADQVEPATSRTGNLSLLNPEISVTGDIVGGLLSPGEGGTRSTALPREFELSFQAALDPYAGTKIFLSKEEELPIAGLEEVLEANAGPGGEEAPGGDIELEEGYLYWVGLPGSLGLKAGKFRQELGLYNRWHTHALLEIERPLATAAFFGDDGLIQSGVSLSLPHLQTGSGTHTVTLEATRADNKLFDGGTNLSYLGRLQSFLDLSPSTYVQVGVNGVTGRNDDVDLDAQALGVDVALRWAPPSRSRYRELTVRGEWYWARRDIGPERESGNGGYAQASYRWDQRWITGFRADILDGFGDAPTAFQLVPSISWWQSEWVRLRLQYNFLKRAGLDPDHTFLFQTVWAIGPHKHETY
jgi:hypothetical protein